MQSRSVRIWCGVWLVLAIVLVARATSRRESKGVILDHLEFGRRLWHGENVYGPWQSDPDASVLPLHAPYPPSFGLLTGPFALLDAWFGTRAARFAWALLQIASLAWIARSLRALLVGRAALAPPPPPATWHLLWLLSFLLAARFVLRDMHGGGGNLINLALCLAAFADAERQRPRRAGLWLGLSLVTKPTQVWLLPMFVVLGRWRAVGWTAVTGAGCLLLTAVLQRFDVAPWQRWLEGSWQLAAQQDAFAVPPLAFPDFEWMNQSLRCALARWLGTVPPEFAARVDWGVSPGLGLAPATVGWITRLASALLLGGVLWTGWRTRQAPAARWRTFAAALVLSVLLSPLSWKAHHVALIPVLMLLLHRALVERRRAIWWLLGAWVLCCQLGGDLVGDAADEWGNSIYIVTAWDVGLLLLTLALARSAAREHRDAARVGESPQLVGQ
ncbi:MAG: DUF2029 domain-containing protein [Planctomycetes bacterium]|nr:DUF2029 domain-containing protein [Planctomycetota bacterium]